MFFRHSSSAIHPKCTEASRWPLREALDALIQLAAYRHSTPGDQKAALDEIFILPDERRSRWRRTGIRTLGPSESRHIRADRGFWSLLGEIAAFNIPRPVPDGLSLTGGGKPQPQGPDRQNNRGIATGQLRVDAERRQLP